MSLARVGEIQASFSAAQRLVAGPRDGEFATAFSIALSQPVAQPQIQPAALEPVRSTAPARFDDDGWRTEIAAAAERNGVNADLFTALVRTESAFRADAISPAGAIGLAQLMPGTAAELGVDPYDPIQNLEGGARYLRQQLDRFGQVELALAAYNAGPARVADAGGIPNIAETRSYVELVLDRFQQITRESA